MSNTSHDPEEKKSRDNASVQDLTGIDADRIDADRIEAQANTNALSRAIAVMILMLIPGVLGSYLDKWLGTQLFVVIGFVLGMAIAIYGLLYVSRIADLAAKKSRELRTLEDSQSENSQAKSRHE